MSPPGAERIYLNRRISAYERACRTHETPPRVGELADYLGMSRWALGRAVRRLLGKSVQERLRLGRLRCAKWYLRHTELPMNRIAYLCGFGTRRTFFKAFR